MKIQADAAALKKTIDRVASYTFGMDLTWDWPGGVAYYGVSRAFEATGEQAYLNRMADWVEEYLEAGLPGWTVNTCAMGHMLLTLYEQTNDRKYLDIIMSKIDYLENKALRFGDRVLQHTVSSKNDFPEQAWADTLFMAAYFMLKVGVKLGEKRLIEDALHQFYWHINYLQDENSGLWYHGYNNIQKNHMSGIYWARANAWAAYTMSRASRVTPEGYLYPPMMHIWSSLRDQLAAIKKLQKEDGLWGTVLDYPEAYGEVSATAGIAAAMIMQRNPLHAKYVNKALSGVLNNVADNGRVLNVSGGTAVMKDIEGYLGIDRKWAQGWGQGLALALLSAALEVVESNEKKEASEKEPNGEKAGTSLKSGNSGEAPAAQE
ncbi:glycoside hydrolase family 88/105 protein [Cohnella thailandensis]|uniref:Glycoside hydrolase family 88 protein n=1 Tax=Cohnella thailandensis TaxID=557557 RepID=A0A841SPV9_9BACL|nr:glycoside hydrolase family 88 protein [Cohnella thailandensis]MBB6634463.1 glycoside hydrolase family 88 protein [Cohnella thailandensis]MBP1972983.1 unsaturated rhamnogalacturonyl hydrolase [Cohnella thailandensis]